MKKVTPTICVKKYQQKLAIVISKKNRKQPTKHEENKSQPRVIMPKAQTQKKSATGTAKKHGKRQTNHLETTLVRACTI